MWRKVRALGVTLLVCFLGGAFQAGATTITTTSYSTWNTATYITGSTTVVDLTTLQAGLNYSTAAGYTSNGFNFTGPDGSSYVLSSQTEGGYTGLLGPSDGSGSIKVALPGTGDSAVLFDASCITCGTLSLTLSDGETFTVSNGQFGLSISHPITWFKLGDNSGYRPFLEYAYFGTSSLPQDSQVSAANEAATPVLLGGGLVILAGAVRKRWLRRLDK
ncbi:MAG TPA: hypothetical protein VHU83_07675 [Bryobacteraceae bacterium]|jgi:hypothetical protein|nr:hypothetical protein [Bryobacteraceae bacterium]